VAADEGFDDDGPEFRAPLPPEDRVWRHPAEMGAAAAAAAAARPRSAGRSPWAVGFVSVLGGVLLAGSLMFAAGGVGDDPGRIALRPIATLAPRVDDDGTVKIADFDIPPAPPSLVGIDVHAGSAGAAGIAGPAGTAGAEVRTGNGLVVESPGYVVTTAMLVADAIDIRVTDAEGVARTGTVVGVDTLNDLAVLHVDGLTAPVTALDRQTVSTVGQPAYVIGAARGVAISTRSAVVVSADARLEVGACDLHGALRLDATLDVSSAGAPLMTAGGTVLGIVTMREPDEPAIVVPVRTVAWAARELVATGQVRHGWLGIEGVTAVAPESDAAGDATDGERDGGALVHRVVDASPAQLAGILADDVVVRIDDERVSTMSGLVVAVREHPPGSTVTVDVIRDGAAVEVPVVLGESPASF
jgi:S1-C subfamily serine protease